MTHLGFLLSSSLAFLYCIYYSGTAAASPNNLLQDPSNDNSRACNCYVTSGPSLGYFQYHRFWDFQSIPSDGADDFTLPPPLLNNTADLVHALPTSAYLSTSDFVRDWSAKTWFVDANRGASLSRFNSAQNIYISRNTTSPSSDPSDTGPTYLTLRATRFGDNMSTAELESNQKNLFHSSIRARMRIIPHSLLGKTASSPSNDGISAGAVAGLFISTPFSGAIISESDTEILTRDLPDQIHYSNQPDYDTRTDSPIPGASNQIALPDSKKFTSWLDHRIDWHEGVSRWYIDDQLVRQSTVNVRQHPAGMVLSLWGNGGLWSGEMKDGGEVVLGVQWVQLVFNTSGDINGWREPKGGGRPGSDGGGGNLSKRAANNNNNKKRAHQDSGKCMMACRVDGVAQIGVPELAFDVRSRTSAAGAVTIMTLGSLVEGPLFRAAVLAVLGIAAVAVWG